MLTINEIGERIAVARKLKNLSQAQLAEQLTVTAQAVGKWERGESMPDILMFQRLAAIFGTDLNYFAGDGNISAETEPLTPYVCTEDNNIPDKPGWDLSQGNWVDADFSGLSGLAEKFNGANIEKCMFIGADMSGLMLKGNNIEKSDFSRANLSDCRFSGANLKNSTFIGCNFSRSNFSGSNLQGCDLSGADLTGVTGKWSTFKKVNLDGAVLYRTTFKLGQMTDMTFTGELNECSFDSCDFARVTFDSATLRQCFFKNAKLKRVKFINCRADRLTYAFMKTWKADLSDVTIIEE